jgi:hypothetical protein
MPLPPINVNSTSGADYLEITWDRPADGSIVGFIVSWGFASGVYTTVENVGNVRAHRITIPFDRSVYAIVQSYDGASPTNFSIPSAEQTRVFSINPVVTVVATPNPLATTGEANDLLWVNPNDPNVKEVDIYRSDNDTVAMELSLSTFTEVGWDLSDGGDPKTWYYTVCWRNGPDGGAQAQFSGRGEIISVEVPGINQRVSATFEGVNNAVVGSYYGLFRSEDPKFSTWELVNEIQIGSLDPTYSMDDETGGPLPVPAISARFSGFDFPIAPPDVNSTEGPGRAPWPELTSPSGTVYPGPSFVATEGIPVQSYTDTIAITNGKKYLYYLVNKDFSNPQLTSTERTAIVEARQLLGSSPPSQVTGVEGTNLGISIVLSWDENIEPNIDHYEVRWAYTLDDLATSPTVVDVGTDTSHVVSGFTPIDNVFVQIFAVDDGIDENGVPRTPYESEGSEIYERIVQQSNIQDSFVSQIDEGSDVTFIFSNVQNVDHFEIEIDADPSFATANKQNLERFLKVEDLVYVAVPHTTAPKRSTKIKWYWRVRPIYPGDVEGFWSTQVRAPLTLSGTVPRQLGVDDDGVRLSNVPYESIFNGDTLVVRSLDGATTYVQGTDYEFIYPDGVARLAGSAIPDGDQVEVSAEFITTFEVGLDKRIVSRDFMNNTLDPLYYVPGSRTTNIFKWFDAIAKGALDAYLIDEGRLKQGRFINKTDPDELYERWGGMVDLITGEIPIPDAFAAISGLYPAFLEAGTKNAIDRACWALTGAPCTISQTVGNDWVLHGDEGPPATLAEYIFEDLEVDPFPQNTYVITLTDFDELYTYNITVRNAARGVQKEVVRGNTGELTDLLGTGNIVDGSVRIIDEFDNLVDVDRYSVDHINGTLTWVEGQELPAGSTYTTIYAAYFNDLIERIFNLLLPAHVNPVYSFQPTSISESLGILVWEDALWDTVIWGD